MDCGLCWVYRLARDGNMTTSTRSNLSHGCSEPPCLIRAGCCWTRLSNYHSFFLSIIQGIKDGLGSPLFIMCWLHIISIMNHWVHRFPMIFQPCLRTRNMVDPFIIYSYHPFDDFPSHKPPFIVCVPLFSDLFLGSFPLIDDFPIKPPCLLEMELPTNNGRSSCKRALH